MVVPYGARWPIPAYELALVLGWKAAGTGAQISLITVEDEPLATLGQAATRLITDELHQAGVQVQCATEVTDGAGEAGEDRPGACAMLLAPTRSADGHPSSRSATFDRLISLPTMIGPALAGLATDANGFVEVDATLRVAGAQRVWAAGGCVAAGLQHSALGARQADAAVEQIAAIIAGADAGAPGPMPEVTGMLIGGQRERWLAENPGSQGLSTRCLWWPPGRAVGRTLAGRIAAWDPEIHDRLPDRPEGLVISAPVALARHHARVAAGIEADGEATGDLVAAARLHDIEHRQLMAIQRRERDADAELRTLSARLDTLSAHQREVIRDLESHGYLTARAGREHPQKPARLSVVDGPASRVAADTLDR